MRESELDALVSWDEIKESEIAKIPENRDLVMI